MKRLMAAAAILLAVACASPTAPASRHVVPQAQHVMTDSTCKSGYIVYAGDKPC